MTAADLWFQFITRELWANMFTPVEGADDPLPEGVLDPVRSDDED